MTYTVNDWDPDTDPLDGWISDWTGARIAVGIPKRWAGSMLEVGCSTGRMSAQLAGPLRRIIAIDRDGAALGRAQERDLPGVSFACGDLLDCVIRQQFDAIVCCSVLHEAEDPHALLVRMGELLHPNGLLFMSVPSAHSFHYRGQPELGERARRFGVKRLWSPLQWQFCLTDDTGLSVLARVEIIAKPYPHAEMACLPPAALDYFGAYEGPGGAVVLFTLVRA